MPRTLLLLLLASLLLLPGCDRMGHIEKIEPKDRLPLLLPRLPVGERPVVEHGEGPSVTVLENGLTVVVQHDGRFPLASLRLYVHAGSAWETPREAGLSHLLEHMVFKGTKRLGAGEAARTIEAAGGEFNAATSFDYTVYYADMPSARWKLGLDVIQDMALNAVIDPTELESERKVVISELEMGEDDPGRRQFKALQEMLWPKTSYGWPIIGTRESLAGIKRADITDYVRRRYQPRNMMLLAVGDVSVAEVLAEARKHFGTLRNAGSLEPAGELSLPLFHGPAVRVEHGKWNKAYVTLAFPVPGLKREQAVGLDLLAQLMGGDSTSRLYRTWKYEKRLVDQISAECMTLERGGAFLIQATLDADKVAEFTAGLAADLATLNPGDFTPEEMARAKLNMEEDLFRSKETLGGLANKIGWFTFFENGQVSEDNYLFALKNADAAMLRSVASAYLRPERLAGVYLLPEGAKTDAAGLAEAVERSWPPSTSSGAAKAAMTGTEPEIATVDGVTVALLPDPTLPYASIEISWPGGMSLNSDGPSGLADFTASYLGKGAGGMDFLTRQVFLSDRASGLGASARRDGFSISARFPTRFTADMLPMVEATVLAPDFPDTELGRVRQEQLAALKRREDRPLGLAFRRLFPFLFNGPGYGSLALGTPESIAAMTPAEARAFWKRQRGLPFVISVCGDFDRDAVLTLAKRLRKAIGQPTAFAQPAPVWNDARSETLKLPGRNQVHLLKVFAAPALTAPDSPALAVLKEVLSGQSGLLFRELRDKQGLGYSVTAMLWQTPQAGFIAFYIGTEPDKADQALKGFDEAIASLQTAELPAEEVQRAVNIISGDYWRERQSISSRSGEAASLLTMGLPLDFAQKQIEAAAKVTPADLKALAAKILKPGEARLMRVEP